MIRATALALLLASPAAAITVPFYPEAEPVVPTVFHDGQTLVTAYHPDPNFFNGDKAKAPLEAAPPVVVVRPGYVRWACYWRTAGAYGPHDRAVQGCPDRVPLATVATAREPRWYIDGGSTKVVRWYGGSSTPPVGPSQIPNPAAVWLMLAALGSLVLVKRVQG